MSWRDRAALRISEVARITGASKSEIRARIASKQLRARRVGRAIFIDPASVIAVYGFESETEAKAPSAESAALVRELLE